MVKAGDVVLYQSLGKTYNAIVLAARDNEPSHLGENGEPLLHLAFIAPQRDTEVARKRPGYIPEVQVVYDVVHASHEFSREWLREKKITTQSEIATQRGGGEWEWEDLPSVAATYEAELDEYDRFFHEVAERLGINEATPVAILVGIDSLIALPVPGTATNSSCERKVRPDNPEGLGPGSGLPVYEFPSPESIQQVQEQNTASPVIDLATDPAILGADKE
jgi:hypothetical protein